MISQRKKAILQQSILFLLLINLGFGCKKENESITPPTPQPPVEFKLIPAGTFMMGSPMGGIGNTDEQSQHKVKLDAFYLDSTELTRGKFALFLLSKDANYLPTEERKLQSYDAAWLGETNAHPILKTSWIGAVAYCNWKTKDVGSKDTFYTFKYTNEGIIEDVQFNKNSKGYRLPTEAEWEYACRAKSITNYSFADDSLMLEDYAWYNTNSGATTQIVGTKKPNSFGLYDMHGNVSEWVWDWYPENMPYYPNTEQENPTGVLTGSTTHIYRGGSYKNYAINLRSAKRFSGRPENRYEDVGIRLARNI